MHFKFSQAGDDLAIDAENLNRRRRKGDNSIRQTPVVLCDFK
ncbi:MAG: hypothetical protein QM763_24190 [Agriterribacter sp.]